MEDRPEPGLSLSNGCRPHEGLVPITAAEKWGAALLIFATLAVGLYPKLLLDRIMPAVEAMRVLKP